MNPSDKITTQLNNLPDWRGDLIKKLHQLINNTAPELTEYLKLRLAVWKSNVLLRHVLFFLKKYKLVAVWVTYDELTSAPCKILWLT